METTIKGIFFSFVLDEKIACYMLFDDLYRVGH